MNEKTLLTKEAFLTELQEKIRGLLGEEYYTKQCRTEKINGVVKETILVRRTGYDCAPSFYSDEMYASYCSGTPVELLAEQLGDVIRRETAEKQMISVEICSKEWLEKNIYVRLVGFSANEELLASSVYVKYLDLAATYYVLTEQGEEGIRSYRLPKEVWESAGLGAPEDYFAQAVQNTRDLFPEDEIPMNVFLERVMKQYGKEAEPELSEMFSDSAAMFLILTNQQRINGAAVILYPGFLEHLAETYGNFYLIPSSVHEILLVREDAIGAKELNAMVNEVNATQVEPEEVLMDHVYYYSEKTGLCIR